MDLNITIQISDTGVICSATVNGADAYTTCESNTLAIGALEIAKASLLAQRWGIDIIKIKPEIGALVGEKAK